VTKGTNHIVGQDPNRILPVVDAILSGRDKIGVMPELWDGHAAERIIEILVRPAGKVRSTSVPANS
jgi:UDP-N-acetylglucosamine 2-epimerase (non-hydrolysing)